MATEEEELVEESLHTKPIVYSPEVEHAIAEVGWLFVFEVASRVSASKN